MIAASTSREHIVNRVCPLFAPTIQRYHMIDLHISVFQIASAISTMTVALLVYCHSNAFWYCFSLCIHYFYLMFSLTKICVFHIIIILTHFMIIISLKAISLKSNWPLLTIFAIFKLFGWFFSPFLSYQEIRYAKVLDCI